MAEQAVTLSLSHVQSLSPSQVTAAKLLEDLDSMLGAIRDIASRLEFIGGGLGVDAPNPRGAALALVGTELAALDLIDLVERMAQCARELAGMPAETAGEEVPHA